jgi:AAA domain
MSENITEMGPADRLAPFSDAIFCVNCQRILGVDCSCVPTRSLSVIFKEQSVTGDSGDNGLSPLLDTLTCDDLPAGTPGTHLPDSPEQGWNPGDIPGDNAGDIPRSLSPEYSPRAHVQSRDVTSWTASGLLSQTFTEPRWAVPGVIPEGVTLLAGPPKIGKSWLALDMCVAVASGGKALGSIDVTPGPVLYLALEDTPRRLQKRLRQVLSGSEPPSGLVLAIECPPLPTGGLAQIARWLEMEEKRGNEPRLIVIDVFERVRGPMPANMSAYAADYAAVRAIKTLADAYGVAAVLIHHVRKVGSSDYLSEISGTLGLPGASDTICVLKRSRGEADGLLQITGRDVEEAEYALRFDPGLGAWQLIGLAADLDISDTRRKILAWTRDHPGDRPSQIALGTGIDRELVKKTVVRMASDGQLDTDHQGRYFPPQPTVPIPDA